MLQPLVKINSFPFVISASPAGARLQDGTGIPVHKQMDSTTNDIEPAVPNTDNVTGYYDYGKSNGQVKIHQGDFLHNHGFRGEGMQMAVLDAGFITRVYQLLTVSGITTRCWVPGILCQTSVDEDNSHGMQCLSTIAANIPGVFVGTAPKTSFYLYRTEDVSSEYPIEEQA